MTVFCINFPRIAGNIRQQNDFEAQMVACVVKSTKETRRLDAAEVAEEVLADYRAKQNTNHAAQKDRSFEHYAALPPENWIV